MQSEMNAIYAKLEVVIKTLETGEYRNYDLIREFLNLKYYVENPKRGISDVEGTIHYATDVMEKTMQDFHNMKHPRFVQADALRRMGEAIFEAWLEPYDDSDWGHEKQRELVARYAQESHDLVVGLYVSE